MNRYRVSFRIYIIASIIVMLFNHCSNPVEDDINYSIKMFYLEDVNISYAEAESLSISEIALESNPFLTDKIIKRFEVLYLEDNPYRTYHIILEESVEANLSNVIRPFIFMLNGDRFCLADYWPSLLSIWPQGLHMIRMSEKFLWLNPFDPTSNSKFDDQSIIESLENLGIEIKYINIGDN